MSLAGGKDEGVYTGQALLDPGSTADQANPKVQQFVTDGQAQGLSTPDIEGGIVSAGWGFAAIFAKALELSKTVDRATVMNTLWSLDDVNFGLMRDDTSAITDGAKDPWMLESLRMVQRQGGQWIEAGPMTDYNGQSNSFAADG